MRRSKRLQAKKTAILSETEGSSQEEAPVIESLDFTSKDDDFIAVKTLSSQEDEDCDEQDVSVDKMPGKMASSQGEQQENTEEFLSLSKEDGFLTLPAEFKRTLKE